MSDRVWGRAEYLLWWTKGNDVLPLVTSSPIGTPQAQAGVLGRPDTTILFGNTLLNTNVRSGGRFTLGYWFEPRQLVGVQADYLFLGRDTTRYDATSTGDPILARPFFDVETGQQAAHLVAFPGAVQGSVSIRANNDFQALSVLLRWTGFEREDGRLDFLAGYRFSRLDDSLRIGETLEAAGPTALDLLDLFDTMNEFHGADFGAVAHFQLDRWSLDLQMKLAFGNSQSRVLIDGATTTTVNGVPPATNAGGLLAQETNIGRYTHNDFAMIPEVGITLDYDITSNLRATFGYTFIYWSNVARPGDQIDPNLNLSQLPPGPLIGAPRPQFALATTDFWAQGMNFGLDYRF